MNRFDGIVRWAWSVLVASVLAFGISACDGDNGRDGADGADGTAGLPGADGQNCWDLDGNGVGDPATEDINGDGFVDVADCGLDTGSIAARIDSAQIESCATCHDGVGGGHQDIYKAYSDASKLALTMAQGDVTSSDNGDGTVAIGVTFQIAFNGAPYVDAAGLPGMAQKRFIFMQYFSGTGTYGPRNCYLSGFVPTATPGEYTAGADCQFTAPLTDWHVYGYVADGELFVHESPTSEQIEDTHVHLYDDVASVAVAFGAADSTDGASYQSKANEEGCQRCHGEPYLKHGYRAAKVDPLPDFAACKSCHYDTRSGSHPDWQYMVDDPYNWATDALDEATIDAKYAYTANIKNDVHMSHAMEFPYPQSMANCSVCHGAIDGVPGSDKLALVLADEYFVPETCYSCHPDEGNGAWQGLPDIAQGVPDPRGKYAQEARAKPMLQIWTEKGVEAFGFHNRNENCMNCHKAEADGGFAPTFAELHTGYDPRMYDAAGNKYADTYTVSIGNITYDDVNSTLTVEFTSSDAAIVPNLWVSFYGWDTKDFLVPSHFRDSNRQRYEYVPESSGGGVHPLFTEEAGSAPGSWIVTADLTAYAPEPELTGSIPALIAAGDIRKVEVTVAPTLSVGGLPVGLTAKTKTFDLGAKADIPNYFQGPANPEPGVGAIVDYENCNACHDQLSVTFHYNRGRGGEMTVCRNCHASTNAGGHLEMQGRSIEGYVHAIHSFQDFDPDETFAEFDPVFARRYDLHINHTFPNFTIRNCEACHNPGTYNVPDQTRSMPGAISASQAVATWYEIVDSAGAVGETAIELPSGRAIGDLPEYVVGPASKACGGCHRADMIAGDDAGELASFNAHTDAFGTLVENDVDDLDGSDVDDEVLFGIIKNIMRLFE